jgi:hypothetical protein
MADKTLLPNLVYLKYVPASVTHPVRTRVLIQTSAIFATLTSSLFCYLFSSTTSSFSAASPLFFYFLFVLLLGNDEWDVIKAIEVP